MEKQIISAKEAARKIAGMVNGRVWDKKEGEVRVYVQGTKNGYLRIAPETTESAQVQFFMKSYDIPKVESVVQAFNELYTVSASVDSEPRKVLIQEDEDGIIAPAGQHEAGVDIVREWYEVR